METFNGLKNKEFFEIKKLLKIDLKLLESVINSNTGHLGDIVSNLANISYSINLKKEKLNKIFKNQKVKLYEKNN